MLAIVRTSKFKKDYKKLQSSGLKLENLKEVVGLLQNEAPLPPEYRDHDLKGEWKGTRECHIGGDWLLIYRQTATDLILYRSGSHSALFG